VLGLAVLDQLLGSGELAADLRKVAAVGGEVVAAVAGFSELTVSLLFVRFLDMDLEARRHGRQH